MSYGKITTVLEQMTGLRVARSTLCRALLRTASKSQPIYQELVETIRTSPVVYPDESGWREGGLRAWLWAFTNRRETVYSIARGRGFEEASAILGKEYAEALVADGWAPYRRFVHAGVLDGKQIHSELGEPLTSRPVQEDGAGPNVTRVRHPAGDRIVQRLGDGYSFQGISPLPPLQRP